MRNSIINRLLEMGFLSKRFIDAYKKDVAKAKRDSKKPFKKGDILTPLAIYKNRVTIFEDLKQRRQQTKKYLEKLSNKKLLEHFESKIREEEADKYIDYP